MGDDPASKSSTVPAVSERSLAAMGVPVLFPRNAEEIITMGMHAVALSRVSGCVVALKIVADVADGAWTIDGSIADFDIVVPEVQFEGKPFVYKQRQMAAPPDSVIAEADLYGPRWDLVHAYGTANNLDVIEVNPSGAKIGIAATGTTFDSVRQALADLGVDDAALHRAGIPSPSHRNVLPRRGREDQGVRRRPRADRRGRGQDRVHRSSDPGSPVRHRRCPSHHRQA